MELQVVRTIHPVGQGAFYTETLHRPNQKNDKHIVYDCGALPYRQRIEVEIDNFQPEGSVIDILFISHFHADHVNGIKRLRARYKIKYVVLPQIDDYEWFYIVENYLSTGNADCDIISELRELLSDATFIQVSPRDEGDNPVSNEPISLENIKGITRLNPLIFDGSRPLVIDNRDFALWHYIVVNPIKRANLQKLKDEIEKICYNGGTLRVDDLRDPEVLVTLQKELQKAYAKVFKDGNEYSMCMLSEMADDMRSCHSYAQINKCFALCRRCFRHCYDWRDCYDCYDWRCSRRDGCLYTGDADFRNSDALDCIKQRLNGRKSHIGLLQLPHHGSIRNFNIELLNWICGPIMSFASYGTPNRYKHPSSDVMGLASTFGCAIGVNQNMLNVLSETVIVG